MHTFEIVTNLNKKILVRQHNELAYSYQVNTGHYKYIPKIIPITYKAHVANFLRLVVVLLLYNLTHLEMPALNHIDG